MALSTYLASTLMMGFVLVALAVALARGRNWREYAMGNTRRDPSEVFRTVASNPTVWVLAFVLFSLVAGGGAIIFVSGSSIPAPVRQGAFLAIVALTAILSVGYIFWGTYQSTRYRGLDNAEATLAALWACGLLFVVTVVVKLVTG
jgi:hypothetical protein